MSSSEDDYDCVMPAAGESKRMEQWKLMLPFEQETIVERSVRNALGFCSRLILVAGHRSEELSRLFEQTSSVTVIVNPEYSFGMFSSIQAGVAHVETPRFFIALADMPLIPASVFRRLAALEEPRHTGGAARPYFQGVKGHPVLLPGSVIDKILQFDKSHTMQEAMRNLPLTRMVTEQEGVVRDIDSPSDYRGLTKIS